MRDEDREQFGNMIDREEDNDKNDEEDDKDDVGTKTGQKCVGNNVVWNVKRQGL